MKNNLCLSICSTPKKNATGSAFTLRRFGDRNSREPVHSQIRYKNILRNKQIISERRNNSINKNTIKMIYNIASSKLCSRIPTNFACNYKIRCYE